MVLFLDEKGEVSFKDIGYSVWLFVLALLESGEHVIIAIPAYRRNYHEHGLYILRRLRSDLAVQCEKGGGVITVHPKGRGGAPHTSLRFCRSYDYKEADWPIVEQLLKEDFPKAMVWQNPK